MDWAHIFTEMRLHDSDYPARTARSIALQRVLAGTQYDHLPHAFFEEEVDVTGEYIPLKKRRPSAKSNLCRVVVDDAVAMLFGDGHMPTVQADDELTRSTMAHLIKEHSFGQLMMEAATKGSVGSIALRLRVLKNKPFFDVLTTEYLTPKWFDDDPLILEKVTERRKVKAHDLLTLGYNVDPRDGEHWFMREWDGLEERWYIPWPVSKSNPNPVRDASRSLVHGLGFIPMVWVRNLPGGDQIDGDSEFERAIDTVIELDYLQSQGGRGLRYSSDPTMVLKGPEGDRKEGGAARALVVAPEGDAKLLEINGSAANAVKEHCRQLRMQAIEQMHGNRADPDKMTAAQSGRAMELLNQSLVWLAGRLRTSYGEYGLLKLLQMTAQASTVIKGGLIVNDKKVTLDAAGMWLKWPDWYPPTAADRFAEMNAFQVGLEAGVISRETAVQTAMGFYSVQDLQAELVRIQSDMKEQDARQTAMLKAEAAAKPKPAAQ
jgi:Phage portal protein, SPP1 Gp6-like